MAYAVKQFLEGARLAKAFDACAIDLWSCQAAVIEQRNRVIDAYGEEGLLLYINLVLLQMRVDE